MPLVEEAIEIDMEPAELFPIISDFEKYSDFMENVKEVKIHEKGDGYSISEWITNVHGIKWIERDHIKQSENRIDFEQIKGSYLKTMGGFWQLESLGSTTRLTFSIHFELGVPMFAAILQPVLVKILRENMQQMLQALKQRCVKCEQV